MKLQIFFIDIDVLMTVNDNVFIIAISTQNTAREWKKINQQNAEKNTQKNTTYNLHCTYTFNAIANKVVTK